MENKTTTKIELDINKQEINRFLFKEYTIDSFGNILDETEFDSESNVVCKRIYRYFDTGEVKEFFEYDPFDDLLERQSFYKNDYGNIEKQEFEFSGGQKLIKEFYFTDIGNAEKVTIRDENDEITGFEVYIYDEYGNITKEIELDTENNEISKFEKAYNEDGTIKFEKQFKDSILFYIETFEYDENQNVIKKLHENYLDKYELVDVYQFDQNNNMIYNSSHQNGMLVFENKCGYDKNNILISEEFFELDFWEKSITKHERLIHQFKNYNEN